MPGRERERERERIRERDRKGERLRSAKKKARARYHCSIGGSTIFDLLEAPKKQKETKKTFHGCPITEEEDEEGSLKEDERTKHLLDCCHPS